MFPVSAPLPVPKSVNGKWLYIVDLYPQSLYVYINYHDTLLNYDNNGNPYV